MSTKTDKMREIRDEIVVLKSSPLYEYRIKNKYYPVIGEGNHNADIMFIGEAPGKNEAMTGKPFCGASGKILDELLEHIGVDRKTVYVTNIVKDRPPENRDPRPDEVAIYGPFLDKQIEIIEPKVIATLGRYAMTYIMHKFFLEIIPISQGHGKVYNVEGKFKLVPLYHPAVAVYNNKTKDTLKEDMVILKNLII